MRLDFLTLIDFTFHIVVRYLNIAIGFRERLDCSSVFCLRYFIQSFNKVW
jgi:hypothetical protein